MSNTPQDTRALIAEAESLRAGSKGKVPKTRDLVREAEQLIGREPRPKSSKRLVLLCALGALVAGAAWVYWLTST